MSEEVLTEKVLSEDDISLKDIKYCAKCGSNVGVSNVDSIATVTCQSDSTRCDFKVTAHDFELRLDACAKRGSMKFCYFCGGDVENVDDFLICGRCTDSIKFNVAEKEQVLIAAGELKYCVVCAAEVKVSESSKKIICSSARCKFRILDVDSPTVTKSLHEYLANGKIKFCYACRSKTSDSNCTNDNCGSRLLRSCPIVRGKPISDSSGQIQRSNDTQLTPHAAVTVSSPARPTASPNPNGTSEQQNLSGLMAKKLKDSWSSIQRALSASNSRPVYKMMLIGETGSGKTSFRNFLCNFNELCDLGLEKYLDKLHLENKHRKSMESKTADAKAYKLMVGDLEVGIIDTPGFGDSRGIEEDRKNIEKIIDSLKTEEYVNCICLFFNGRQARITIQLQYVLSEISATLPKTAFDNLIIIMTNCQSELLSNIVPEELVSASGVVININRVFYIDNPFSILENVPNQAPLVSHKQPVVKELSSQFQKAGETLVTMLDLMKNFKEVCTNCFVELHELKKKMELIMLSILKADENRQELEAKLLQTKDELDAAVRMEILNKDFESTIMVTKVMQMPTKEHNTICGAPQCNSNCHVPCSLPKTLDNENLKQCNCIDKNNDFNCIKCGHSYKQHFHLESLFETQNEPVVRINKDLQQRFDNAKSQQQLCTELKAECDSNLEECKKKMEDLCMTLNPLIQLFQTYGSNPSYKKMINNQVSYLDQAIEAREVKGHDLKQLKKTKANLTRMLNIVERDNKKEGAACI